MTKGRIMFAGLFVAGLMAVGCEKKSETPTVPPPPQPRPEATVPEVQTPAVTPAAPAAPAEPAAPAAPAAADVTTQAQKLLDQATEYIKDKKWDLAEQTLTKLEGMKAQLPAEWASKIDGARKTFDAAKAAGAIQMPGATSMPHGM